MGDEGIPTYRLLQPELMTHEELVEVLQKYNLKCDLERTEITELISIYKRLALPFPQRIYGSTWRERLLAKKQNRRKISISDAKSTNEFTIKSSASSPADRLAQRDRLKPPVSAVKEKKVIKLSSSKKISDAVSNKIDAESSLLSPSESEKTSQSKHKRIKIDFSDSSERSTPIPKVVGSKRLSSSSDEKGPTQPLSKHRRIVI